MSSALLIASLNQLPLIRYYSERTHVYQFSDIMKLTLFAFLCGNARSLKAPTHLTNIAFPELSKQIRKNKRKCRTASPTFSSTLTDVER